WAAGTAAGIALRSVTKLALPPLPFILATFLFTFPFLLGPRGYLVYQKTGQLPDVDELVKGVKVPPQVQGLLDKAKSAIDSIE
ncbi:hypothetical protein TeGR_g4003, partial [Tetraparma gracilis]